MKYNIYTPPTAGGMGMALGAGYGNGMGYNLGQGMKRGGGMLHFKQRDQLRCIISAVQ